MASDSEQYSTALRKWDQLHAEGQFSAPPEVGSLAIILAYDHARDANPLTADAYPTFECEAFALADRALATGKKIEIAVNASRNDVKHIAQDPKISDLIVLGNGCLSAVNLSAPESRLGWKHISNMTDHLKTGRFTQRFCGTLPRDLNVPLGLMAMASHSAVIAPINRSIAPKSLDARQNHYLRPITDQDRLTYEDIKRLLPKRKLPLSQRISLKTSHLLRRARLGEFRRFPES